MLIKSHGSKSIRGAIGDSISIKEFILPVEERFVQFDIAFASTLLKQLTSEAFGSSKVVRAHITKTRDLASELKALKIEISEPFLVYFILDSLPFEYGPFKISYFTQKNCSSMDLLTMCVQT